MRNKETSRVPKIIEELRRNLSHSPDKPISRERLGRLLSVSLGTVRRWELEESTPDLATILRLARLRRVLELLGELVLREDRLSFLENQNRRLLNVRPIDLLNTDEGELAILDLLRDVEAGTFG